MNKLKFFLKATFALCILGLLFVSCTDDDDNATQKSALRISMVDAPGDYEEVNIEVLDVLIKNSSDEGEKGWVSVGDPDVVGEGKIINLLDLTGGVNLLMVDTLVPSGHLGQIRLILGDENTVKVDGESHPLDTPSAQQSGLKLNVNQDLDGGVTYNFILDFDVDKSIVTTGSDKYILKPVIKVTTTATSGGIKGLINPMIAYQVQVLVVDPNVLDENGMPVVVASSYVNDDGMFQVTGLPAGTYNVIIDPDDASGKEPITKEGVVVENGLITDIGTVSFPDVVVTP